MHISMLDLFAVGKQDVHFGDQGIWHCELLYYTINLMCNSW